MFALQRLDPRQERESWVRQTKESGSAPQKWHSRAMGTFAAITAGADKLPTKGRGPTWSSVECFQGGCLADATYHDQQAFGEFDKLMIKDHDSPFHTWPGQKRRSPPVRRDDGTVVATWFLMTPDEQFSNQGR